LRRGCGVPGHGGGRLLVGGWSWVFLSLIALAVFALAGLADIVTSRVELLDDRLVIVRNLRQRVYDRSSLVRVTWAKGGPVSVQTAAGDWIALPGVGPSSLGMVNSLRAWLKDKDN
jgi:hypothetical protein